MSGDGAASLPGTLTASGVIKDLEMSHAEQRGPSLDELYHELQRTDRAWLLETLQQRWKHLERAKQAPANPMRGIKRSRSPSPTMEPTNYLDPHDLTASILPPDWAVSEYVSSFRAVDWASTSLGSMQSWSPTLRRITNFLLADPRAAAVYWGKDRVMLYNESYRTILAEKHPWALGRPCKEVWPTTGALLDGFKKGDATGCSSGGNQEEFTVERRGFPEEVCVDWSLVPIADGLGSFAYYNAVTESTAQVQYQRQMHTLLSLERHTLDCKSQSDFWKHVLKGLESNHHEVPFALLYSSQSSRRTSVASTSDSFMSSDESGLALEPWGLEGSIGIPSDSVPTDVDTEWATENISSTFMQAISSGIVQIVPLRNSPASNVLQNIAISRAHGDACTTAVLIPIGRQRGDQGSGFLLLGLNSRRMYDATYESFIRLLHRQLVSTLVSVKMAEDENRHAKMSAEMAALDRTILSTQLEKTSQEARDNERRFRTTAETLPIAMYELSMNGDILFANKAYYDLTGIDPNNIYPFCWEDIIDQSQKATYEEHFRQQFDGETVRFEVKLKKPWVAEDLVRGERIQGETWVLSAGYALRNPDGSVRALQGALIDISRQKWMEGSQERKLKEAIEMKRQQETFMDMVGHEIRNPLSAITLCASSILESLEIALEASRNDEVVLKRTDVDSHIENSEIITTCINHQRRIIDDVLCLSKLDSGLLVVAPCEIQPKTLIEQSLRMFAAETEQSEIELRCLIDDSYKEEKIDWVMLDPSRVLQVFLNLVTNAIKFTRKENNRNIDVILAASTQRPDRSLNGTVYLDFPVTRGPEVEEAVISPNPDEVFIMITVKDTGCGIKMDELQNIFMRFQQSSPKTHVTYGGSGLGLFISRELAKLQGGRVGVSSEYGHGSSFEFYVRATRCQPPKNATVANQTNGPTRRISLRRKVTAIRNGDAPANLAPSYHILLVEDNLVNQRVMSKQLESAGHRVYLANHGGECLDFIKGSRFCKSDGLPLDVILLGLEMPIMGGLEATRRIRESETAGEVFPSIPIIAVKANARGEQQLDARDAGVNAVVTKPFQMQELLREVESVLPVRDGGEGMHSEGMHSEANGSEMVA